VAGLQESRKSKIIVAIFCAERTNVFDLMINLNVMLFSEYWRLIGRSESRRLDNFLSSLDEDIHTNVFCEKHMSDVLVIFKVIEYCHS
jgi:hypothetical protein